jgi:hypothetical protein
VKWFLVLTAICTGTVPPQFAREARAILSHCHDGLLILRNDTTQGPWNTKQECEQQLRENTRWIGNADVPDLPGFPLKSARVRCVQMGDQ